MPRLRFAYLPALATALALLPVARTHAEPPADRKWVPFAPMSDEFDGDRLDTAKWHASNPQWKGRPPVFFHPDCVAVRDGKLHLSALPARESAARPLPEGFTHIAGFIVSKSLARFGYFEFRAKLMNSTLVSCFWLSRHTPEEWSEIDVVEVPAGIEKFKNLLQPNLHYFHGPHFQGTLHKHIVEPSQSVLPFNLADDFHVYGVEWSPTHLRWFVDGALLRSSPNRHCFQPLALNINIESNDYFGARPDDTRLPATFEIDWVRAWRPAAD